MSTHLEQLQEALESRGLSGDVSRAIRNSKICIIDDRLDDLRSFVEALRGEGFNNVVEKKAVTSINELAEEGFDLIILDLGGVAADRFQDDGVGVLGALKRRCPWLPVLVVSGSTTGPQAAQTISLADAIRTKPILPSELAMEVEDLLKYRKDAFWAAYAVLSEIRKLKPELAEALGWRQKLWLRYLQFRIERDLANYNQNVTGRLVSVANTVSKLGMTTARIVRIAKGLG